MFVLMEVSRLFFPDSCSTSSAGITGQHPQLAQGQLSRGEGKPRLFLCCKVKPK